MQEPRAPKGRKPLNDLTKNILLWVVIVTVLLLVFSRYMPIGPTQQEIPYSQFLDDVKGGRVASVVLPRQLVA